MQTSDSILCKIQILKLQVESFLNTKMLFYQVRGVMCFMKNPRIPANPHLTLTQCLWKTVASIGVEWTMTHLPQGIQG